MTDIHQKPAKRHARTALYLALLLGVGSLNPSVFAAEPPELAETIDMSVEVGAGLNEVIALMNEQKLDEASAALQSMRAALQGSMNAYEEFRVLDLSGTLNTAMQKYPEAIADYEAVLQMANLSEDERLTSVEHLLTVNELEGGQNKETLFRIAFSYSQLGQAATAVPYMEQALTVAGDGAGEDYYKNMALLYIGAAQPAKAIETYEKLLEIAPDSADGETTSANLAALYIEVGSKVKARAVLRALISDYPDSDRIATYQQSLNVLNGAQP
jgi:tetratricopeptide (TPR) repeat protein